MRLRPYINSKDYTEIEKWIDDERIHALWCANLIPYPLTEKELDNCLKQNATDWGDCAFVITEDDGTPIGFFVYSANVVNNSGFLKFVVLNSESRGKGFGTEMLQLILKYAFEISRVDFVQLNVFDVNTQAKRCYEKAGFVVDNCIKNVFPYKDEKWGRCHMVAVKK